ncbi:MAG: beta-Ala-His dipeptidase, partial [Bacteroidales bacterium]|nr:beta-Ala-His dipeptidase [Bacteroidales bacterium]
MEYTLENLKPERLFHYFYEILNIPRPSKKEEKIIAYLVAFGEKHNLETLRDEVGNVLIRKDAFSGCENYPVVCLQSHIDMVCEKNSDTVHDFDNDPIIPRIEGEWLKATGTTLGADDGIGVAAQLAILESSEIKHGPLECLFTVDEETGLSGAFGLQSDFLKASVLLNLDSEDDGELFIGCAGGIDTLIELDYETVSCPENSVAFSLSLTGLKGGHSGDEINKGLGNAVKLMNRFLWFMQEIDLKVATFNGGNLRNAIPREAFAIVVVPEGNVTAFTRAVSEYNQVFRAEFHVTEPNLSLVSEVSELPLKVVDAASQANLLNSLYACPHGVIAM